MTPEDRMKQLIEKWKKVKEKNKDKEFKSISECGIQISEEALKWWRNNS